MSRRRAAMLLAVVLLAAGVAWVAWPKEGSHCTRSAELVPSCGVLWGVATDPNTYSAVRSVEDKAGYPFDLIYRFHDLDDRFPTADERSVVASGRVLHIAIDARIYGSPQVITWRDIAAGQFDADLTRQARGIASLKASVFMTFDHESDRAQRAPQGSPADFIAAWRHVHDLFVRARATNAVWVWVVTGYPPLFSAAGRTWPGNHYVDWISWEAYNGSGCSQSAPDPAKFTDFASSALPFYRWVHEHGAEYGIDTAKPMMISEAGSVVYRDHPALTATWYRQIPDVLKQHTQIKAIALWDRPGNAACNYRFDDAPGVPAAVGQAGVRVQYPSHSVLGIGH